MQDHIMTLPHAAPSAGVARRALSAAMQTAGVMASVAEDAAVIFSELVGNAIRHGRSLPGGVIQVSWRITREVVAVRVTDGGGAASPQRRDPSEWESGGRGLWIVERLTADWGVDRDAARSSVWARVGYPAGWLEPAGAAASG